MSGARTSRRAWSGGTGKHSGPQTGTAIVLDHVELPPPPPVEPTILPVLVLHTAAAPAAVLLPGAWCRRFKSTAGAIAWCDGRGLTIKNREAAEAAAAKEQTP